MASRSPGSIRALRGTNRSPGFWLDTAMSAIRGCGFALGASYLFGAPFGITFGVLSTVGQAIAYRFGIRPTVDYKPAKRPRITRFQLLAAANRTVGYAVTGYVSSLVAHQREHAIAVGLKAGLDDWRGHGDRRLLHAVCRMDGRSCAGKTHGCLWRWPDSDWASRCNPFSIGWRCWMCVCGRRRVNFPFAGSVPRWWRNDRGT